MLLFNEKNLDSTVHIPDFKVLEVGDIQALSETIPWSISDLKIPEIWAKTRGENITVAVVDSGIDINHFDLKENIIKEYSRSFHEWEKTVEDLNGHGTASVGVVGANQNARGIVGVAPKAKIIAIKALGQNGLGTNASIVRSLSYIWTIRRHVDVINLSLGSKTPLDDRGHDIIKKLHNYGIPIIAAAGNDPDAGIMYPARYPEVFAVGSYSPNLLRDRSDFSAKGPELDFMAGGDKVLTTWPGDKFATLQGTSFSAPLVAGTVALLISKLKNDNISFTVEDIKNILIDTCITRCSSERTEDYGYGIINPRSWFEIIKTQSNDDRKSLISRLLRVFRRNK